MNRFLDLWLAICALALVFIIFFAGMEYQTKRDCENRGGAYSLDYGLCMKIDKKDILK